MTKLEAWYLHVTFAVVTLTGAVFAWMKYFMHTDDPFAVANHPWQPSMLDGHVIFAPLLLFGLGVIFDNHVMAKLRRRGRVRRRSGLTALWFIAPMVLSGYLLQVGTNELFRKAMAQTHWVSSSLFVLAYVVHQFSRRTAH